MLERIEGLTDSTKHHLQESQEIRPHVSGRSSDLSTQLGHLSYLDSHYSSRSQKTSSADSVGKLLFFVLVPYEEFVSRVTTVASIYLFN
jgi:hypothetical protein